MLTFRQGQVVRVPFPYTDRNTRQHRPALVVSDGPVGEGGRLLWVVMVTSAANPRWAGDVELASHQDIGLPIPSVVRPTKVATIEASDAEILGQIDAEALLAVKTSLDIVLGRHTP